MALDVTVPGDYVNIPPVTFIAANATYGKILVDKLPAGGGGNQLLPSNAVLTGGGRILDITASSTDTNNRDVILDICTETTLGTNMGTIGITATTNSTVTRSSGSFITDGWVVGDLMMLFNANTSTNNGTVNIVTGVAAGTLTLNGTTTLSTAETPTSALRMFRISPDVRVTIAGNSGVGASSSSNTQLVAAAVDAAIDRSGIWLGSNNVIVARMATTISALPAFITMDARVARY